MVNNIVTMVRSQAAKFADREVFRFFDKTNKQLSSISWTDFIRQVDQVAASLYHFGYDSGENVGIFSNNKPEWLITDLGIMANRAVVVPFYATASASQVKYIVDETAMRLMFVGSEEQLAVAKAMLQETETLEMIVVFDADYESDNPKIFPFREFIKIGCSEKFKERKAELETEWQPDDLATIIYTSGTTGEQKGVMLGHDNFMFSFAIHDKRLHVTKDDLSMCFLPLSHVFERTWSLYLLHTGATNFILENPREVIEYLPKVKPTLMCTVPRFFDKTYEGIVAEKSKWPGWKQKVFDWAIGVGHVASNYRSKSLPLPSMLKFKYSLADAVVLKKLRLVFGGNIKEMPCAGAAIRPELLRFFHAAGIFINYGYGATETVATVSCFRIEEYDFDTCGTIMPDIYVKISGDGEILVKGGTVFKGYYKKPEATAEVLKDGWYYTGDEGRIKPKDALVMSDRIKDLMKTSVGKYVSPQKLELLLGQDELIEQVITVGDNQKFVTALIVPAIEPLKKLAKSQGIDFTDVKDLVRKKEIIETIRTRINLYQQDLTPYERVVDFRLLHEPFSIENQAMTSTLKLRRRVITSKYRHLIDEMYSNA